MYTALLIVAFVFILLVVLAGLSSSRRPQDKERRPLQIKRKEPLRIKGGEPLRIGTKEPLRIEPPAPLRVEATKPPTPGQGGFTPDGFKLEKPPIIVKEVEDEDGPCWVWGGLMKSFCPCDDCVEWRASRNGNG